MSSIEEDETGEYVSLDIDDMRTLLTLLKAAAKEEPDNEDVHKVFMKIMDIVELSCE